METSDKMTEEQEQRGIEAEHDDKGNLNLVTHCGIGRLSVSAGVLDGIGSFIFFETKEESPLIGEHDPGEDGLTGLSHEIRFHSIESLDNIINLLTKFRDKWRAGK